MKGSPNFKIQLRRSSSNFVYFPISKFFSFCTESIYMPMLEVEQIVGHLVFNNFKKALQQVVVRNILMQRSANMLEKANIMETNLKLIIFKIISLFFFNSETYV